MGRVRCQNSLIHFTICACHFNIDTDQVRTNIKVVPDRVESRRKLHSTNDMVVSTPKFENPVQNSYEYGLMPYWGKKLLTSGQFSLLWQKSWLKLLCRMIYESYVLVWHEFQIKPPYFILVSKWFLTRLEVLYAIRYRKGCSNAMVGTSNLHKQDIK